MDLVLAVLLVFVGTGAIAGGLMKYNDALSNLDARIQDKNQRRRLSRRRT